MSFVPAPSPCPNCGRVDWITNHGNLYAKSSLAELILKANREYVRAGLLPDEWDAFDKLWEQASKQL